MAAAVLFKQRSSEKANREPATNKGKAKGAGEGMKNKKCDECFETKADVKKREYEDIAVMLCDDCYEQNTGYGQQEKQKDKGEDLEESR